MRVFSKTSSFVMVGVAIICFNAVLGLVFTLTKSENTLTKFVKPLRVCVKIFGCSVAVLRLMNGNILLQPPKNWLRKNRQYGATLLFVDTVYSKTVSFAFNRNLQVGDITYFGGAGTTKAASAVKYPFGLI